MRRMKAESERLEDKKQKQGENEMCYYEIHSDYEVVLFFLSHTLREKR